MTDHEKTTEKLAPLAPALTCPACGQGMVEVDAGGVLIDVCGGCNALWLDKGELEQLGGKLPPHSGTPSEAKRTCPRCLSPLDRRDAHLVKLDVCWGCGGFFLDSAAYETLVEASGGRTPCDDDDATPAAGTPAVAAAVGSPAHRREAAQELQPRFSCDLCRRPFPVSEQVVGERITACPACAKRQGIKHDPKARWKAEREKVEARAFEDDIDPATLLSKAVRYLLGK